MNVIHANIYANYLIETDGICVMFTKYEYEHKTLIFSNTNFSLDRQKQYVDVTHS